MSILIKGMEMPKKYPVTVTIFPDGITIAKTISGRRFTATAIPVKPHGRLVDADALIRELEITEEDDHNGATLLMAVFLEVLKSAPTVIDAEEE